jgi:hypothetical protein
MKKYLIQMGFISAICLLSCAGKALADDAQQPEEVIIDGQTIKITPKQFEPTLRDVAYGPHERNKLDFWKAESDEPTPLVFYIHGGGWGAGSKESNKGPFLNLLKDGVSYVSINYRLARDGNTLPCSVHDAARALQFVRSKAKEWNIDPDRIIASGGSAGGCSSLWLNYHDDMADPDSDDPVARQSTRVCAAAVLYAQSTLDPWLINSRMGPQAASHSMIWASVGAKDFHDLVKNWDDYEALSRECSPITHLSQDDPPVFMVYNPAIGPGIHYVEFGLILKQACDKVGLDCTMEFHNSETRQAALERFMLDTFKKLEK